MKLNSFWPAPVAAALFGCLTAFAGTLAISAPSVSGVSGTLSHGAACTVKGAGFGTHANYNAGDSWSGSKFLNFRFKDFEDGSLTSNGFYPQSEGGTWNTSSTELGVRSGGPKNSTHYVSRTYVTNEAGGLSTNVSGSGNQLYTTFKFMLPSNTQSGKFFRFYANSPMNDVWLSSGCGNMQIRGSTDCSASGCANGDTDYGGGPSMAGGTWHRVEIWADSSKNQFVTAVDGVQAFSKSNWLAPSLAMNGHTLDYPNMIDSSARSSSCPAVGSYNYDDIFVDFTQARVEIGDAATWSAVKTKEVQIPTAWADGSVSFEMNAGAFSTGQKAWLYVVDSNGNVNSAGYPVTIGAAGTSGGAAPPPPVVPDPPTHVTVD